MIFCRIMVALLEGKPCDGQLGNEQTTSANAVLVTASSFKSRVSQGFKIESAVRDITVLVPWTRRNSRPAARTISPGWFSLLLLGIFRGSVGFLRSFLVLVDVDMYRFPNTMNRWPFWLWRLLFCSACAIFSEHLRCTTV